MRILELTLKKKWFDMILSGEKKEEYREWSKWIMSRLKGKTYDYVRFRNGYSKHSPVVVCEYLGWKWGWGKLKWGGVPKDDMPLIVIKLGEKRNIGIASKMATGKR